MATYLCSVKSKACKRENATSTRIDKNVAQKLRLDAVHTGLLDQHLKDLTEASPSE